MIAVPLLAQRTREVAALFFKLGLIGFGGPAATIAMMEEEVVVKRQWVTEDRFLDLVGVTNLIPGPNATEMAIHLGYIRAGWAGLVLGGVGFILPGAVITMLLAWAYVRYGNLPQLAPLLYGIKPAVISVIISALWRLGSKAVKNWRAGAIGVLVVVASLLGSNEVLALFLGGLVGMFWLRGIVRWRHAGEDRNEHLLGALPALPIAAMGAPLRLAAGAVSLWQLAAFFLKVGAVLYGSGYVLVAFLEGDLVQEYGWLTQQQLLDAIAAGQFTPGPLSSTASFVGYVLGRVPGAIIATLAMFFPSFCFVIALRPLVPRLRASPWSAAFLDAVNVSSLGLMGAVTVKLGMSILTGWQPWLIAILAAIVGLRWRLNSAWLVLGGAILGFALFQIG